MNLYFTYESRATIKSFASFITVETIAKLIRKRNDQFEIKIYKVSCRSSRSLDNAKFGHFTLLSCRERQRNVQRTRTAIVLLIYSFVPCRSCCLCRRGFVNSLLILQTRSASTFNLIFTYKRKRRSLLRQLYH